MSFMTDSDTTFCQIWHHFNNTITIVRKVLYDQWHISHGKISNTYYICTCMFTFSAFTGFACDTWSNIFFTYTKLLYNLILVNTRWLGYCFALSQWQYRHPISSKWKNVLMFDKLPMFPLDKDGWLGNSTYVFPFVFIISA